MRIWTEAAKRAILRHVERTGSPLFTRRALIDAEMAAIMVETRTAGVTPAQTLGRELQQLRDDGLLEFLDRGTYRWLGPMTDPEPVVPGKGVFVLQPRSLLGDLPQRAYLFPSEWARTALRTIDQWILYQDPDGYQGAARVLRIDPQPARPDLCRATIAQDSYLEFGRTVPLHVDGEPVERGLRDLPESAWATQPVRTISDGDFDRILALGLVTDGDVLPRSDEEADAPPAAYFGEERNPWEEQVDRTTMLVNRIVRNKQFRKRVLDAYGARCALTGMKLINGGGRAETEAAHIMSVEAGGPDAVNNGIALSGTIHWMFDRGLISLSDGGDILLSRKINDRESVERLIHPDRKARLPASAVQRPHPHYLHWHRTMCFHD